MGVQNMGQGGMGGMYMGGQPPLPLPVKPNKPQLFNGNQPTNYQRTVYKKQPLNLDVVYTVRVLHLTECWCLSYSCFCFLLLFVSLGW